MSNLSRRDFLKLTGALSGGAALNGLRASLPKRAGATSGKPNFLILLFDAMSAPHLSVNGFARPTTPNMERFASHANVYHSFYSGGNFTSPGTASMLTGRLPWSHRAINMGALVRRDLADENIFSAMGEDYSRFGFAQNAWADLFLRQFDAHISEHMPHESFILKPNKPLVGKYFDADSQVAYISFEEFILNRLQINPAPSSLTFGHLNYLYEKRLQEVGQPTPEMPYGFPFNGLYFFDNREVFDGVAQTVVRLHSESSPFLAYFHFFSPHYPYCPRKKFVGSLPDVKVVYKPHHPLANRGKMEKLVEASTLYDEYIATVDDELGRLLDSLEAEGVFEDTYVILTSDHGELFERGENMHTTPLLFERIINIPLLVSSPGQTARRDIFTPASNTDLMPTLLGLAGRPIPQGLDGKRLPGLGGTEDEERPVISVEAKSGYAFQPLNMVTVSMIKGNMKLIYYKGYQNYSDIFELYDLEHDREEKKNLIPGSPAFAPRLKDELLSLLDEADKPYRRK
jgi:arylsulfatase A-like enzyme